jgi:hypothetical protein
MIRFVDERSGNTTAPEQGQAMHSSSKPRTLHLFITAIMIAFLALAGPSLAQTGSGTPTPIAPGASGGQPYPQNQPPPPQGAYPPPAANQPYQGMPPPGQQAQSDEASTFSNDEILNTGHRFFGRVSTGLARVIEYSFSKSGRPNGYILGEEAGGAFVAGLRYGEGTLHTKDAGKHKVFWQGPSIGYDFGAEGSKTMVLVYNLRSADEMFGRFGGVDGSAYFIGGVGMTYQKRDHITLAPIRSGVGLRLGANVGYLKFTRRPTWNPF